MCFKAHVDYFERTIVLPQITNAVSSIRTAAVAEGDSPAVGNTIELLSLNQRIRFPVWNWCDGIPLSLAGCGKRRKLGVYGDKRGFQGVFLAHLISIVAKVTCVFNTVFFRW